MVSGLYIRVMYSAEISCGYRRLLDIYSEGSNSDVSA
jgi:hypothetical protein